MFVTATSGLAVTFNSKEYSFGAHSPFFNLLVCFLRHQIIFRRKDLRKGKQNVHERKSKSIYLRFILGTKQVTSPMCLSDANLPIYSEVTQFLKLKSHFLFARTGVSIFACLNGSNYVYFFTENFRPVRSTISFTPTNVNCYITTY